MISNKCFPNGLQNKQALGLPIPPNDHELCSQYKNTRSPEVPRSPLPSPNLLGGSLAHQIVFGKVSRRA